MRHVGALLLFFALATFVHAEEFCSTAIGRGFVNCPCGTPFPITTYTTTGGNGVCLGQVIPTCDPGCEVSAPVSVDCASCMRGFTGQRRCDEWYCVSTDRPQLIVDAELVGKRVLVLKCGAENYVVLADILRMGPRS